MMLRRRLMMFDEIIKPPVIFDEVVVTTTGASTWTVPADCKLVSVCVVAAGQNGAKAASSASGKGGDGGEVKNYYDIPVVAGSVLNLYVGSANGDATTGRTYFKDTNYIANISGKAGGASVDSTTGKDGEDGSYPFGDSSYGMMGSSGGGGGATTLGILHNNGGSGGTGAGNGGKSNNNPAATAATTYGSGGGGGGRSDSTYRNGAAGMQGVIIIRPSMAYVQKPDIVITENGYWTVPSRCIKIDVCCIGAGGNGKRYTTNGTVAGGKGGEVNDYHSIKVTPGEVLPVQIGVANGDATTGRTLLGSKYVANIDGTPTSTKSGGNGINGRRPFGDTSYEIMGSSGGNGSYDGKGGTGGSGAGNGGYGGSYSTLMHGTDATTYGSGGGGAGSYKVEYATGVEEYSGAVGKGMPGAIVIRPYDAI